MNKEDDKMAVEDIWEVIFGDYLQAFNADFLNSFLASKMNLKLHIEWSRQDLEVILNDFWKALNLPNQL